MFDNEQQNVTQRIYKYCIQNNLPETNIQWKWIPFSGHWGISTSFFQLAAREARTGKNIVVNQRAQELAELVASDLADIEGFARIEAKNGYLNLYFDTGEYSRRVIDRVLQEEAQFGRGSSKAEKIMVEFSQPNTHKAFHVGHLRNVILGESICRLLDFAGYDVVRANYIGDIGLHVIKWLWNYQSNHFGEVPGEDKTRWMGEIYSEADQKYEESDQVKTDVRQLFAKWDQRDEGVVELWRQTRQWSLDGFEQIYNQLDVHFDRVYFESEVEEIGKGFVQELITKKIARDERPEGAVIVPLDEILGEKEKYRVLVVLRSDGTSLYSTKDLPLAKKKFDEFKLSRSVYIIDVRQSLYMQQIFKTLELMGYLWAKNCFHLAYEIVNLPGNVTMSSRDGTVVLLEDLIQEATERALEIVKAKNPDLPQESQGKIAAAVAMGAIKYPMLSRENTKTVTFDWNTALDLNGQAAPYIQYAFVRANSILKKSGIKLPGTTHLEYELSEPEIQLIDLISRLPDEVEKASYEFRPLYLSNLGYEIARAFNDFYNQCPVLQAEDHVKIFRLRMVAAARQTIKNILFLLGIEAPDVM